MNRASQERQPMVNGSNAAASAFGLAVRRALILLVVCVGCRSSQVPPDWKPTDTQTFTFYVPSGFAPDPAAGQGIDSEAGVIQGPGMRISYDSGMYFGCAPGAGQDTGQTIHVNGASKATLTVPYRTSEIDSLPYTASLCAVSTHKSGRSGLHMTAYCANEERLALAARILRTADLKPRQRSR